MLDLSCEEIGVIGVVKQSCNKNNEKKKRKSSQFILKW